MQISQVHQGQMQGAVLSWDNPQHICRLDKKLIGNNLAENELLVPVDQNLDMTLKCALAAQKAICIQGSIEKKKNNYGQ